jgi:hypothetical protein
MPHSAVLPFVLRRSNDVIAQAGIKSTQETVHGLLVLQGECVVIQWRVDRQIDRIGPEIRSDHEADPVREVVVPISGLASARMRSTWWQLFGKNRHLVLSASDLRTFEPLAGPGGLTLSHPGELILGIRIADRRAAREFASELDLALAEQALRRAEGPAGDAYIAGEDQAHRALERGDDSGRAT